MNTNFHPKFITAMMVIRFTWKIVKIILFSVIWFFTEIFFFVKKVFTKKYSPDELVLILSLLVFLLGFARAIFKIVNS